MENKFTTTVLGIPIIKGKETFHYMLYYLDSIADIWESEMLLPIGAKFYHISGIFEVTEYDEDSAGELIVNCEAVMDYTQIRKIHEVMGEN